MARSSLLSFLLGFLALSVFGQQPGISAHEHHQQLFKRPELTSEQAYDQHFQLQKQPSKASSRNCILQKQVYGFHPAWSGTSYTDYDFGLLSRIAYFSYEVDAQTGGYTSINHWRESQIVETAHNAGAQVDLCASLFGGKAVQTLLGNEKASQNLIDSLVALVKAKDADGICIDFEGMKASSREPFTQFITKLSHQLKSEVKGAELSITLYAVDWEKAFDLPALSPLVDRMIVMSYDYHYAGSQSAGPVAPLEPSELWGKYSVRSSLEYYHAGGVPNEKLLMGVPYYGYSWPTSQHQPKAKSQGTAKAVLLRDFIAQDSSAWLEWDTSSHSGFIPSKKTNGFQQLWIDQGTSLNEKYRLANQMDLGGVAIWALGYDHGSDNFWNLLKANFADCEAAEMESQSNGDPSKPMPWLTGQSSADRNTYNWVWMLGGGIAAILIMWAVKRWL
jgi:spore germination protein YaaH